MKPLKIIACTIAQLTVMFLFMSVVVYSGSMLVCWIIENGEPHDFTEIVYVSWRLFSMFICWSVFKLVWDSPNRLSVKVTVNGGAE